MADPPVPAPWTPFPLPSIPNPWPAGTAPNTWDPSQLLPYLESTLAPQIKQAFGQSISLSDLLDLFKRFGTNNLTDQELVRLIEMGIYFARTNLNWQSSAANLEHWLDAGISTTPWTMSSDLVKNRTPITDALCGKYYDLIVSGAQKRIKASAGELFPSAATIVGPLGEVITLTPAASPLAAGGEETIYIEQSVATSGDHTEDIYNAVAAVWLDSRVKVKSEKLAAGGGWQVTILEWECWFWDDYDWGLSGQSVVIPIHLFDRLGIPNEQRDLFKTYFGIDPSVLDEIKIADKTMLQIEGKEVNMPDGKVLHPKAYRIYGDSTWRFDSAAEPCSRPITWVVQ